MKQKRIIISLLVMASFLIFGKYDAQAETILENQYTNPYYKDVTVTTPNNNSNVDTYSLDSGNAEYTSDIKKVAENFKEQLVKRESEITLYYHCDEKITGEYFNDLTSQLFDLAVQHTGKGNEGDYILCHCQGWYVRANWSSSSNGGHDMNITYTVSYLSDAAQEEKVDRAEKEVFQKLKLNGKSDYQKIKAIYDYICSNVSYDYTNLNDDTYIQKYTAYAALIDKTAVCQGYASLLYRMVLDAGVDARVISGDAGGPHAWNIVQLNGRYYNLDATWDAGRDKYFYFLKNMKGFSDHERNDKYSSTEFTEAYPMAESDYPVNHVHNIVIDEAVEPTCTTDGKMEGSHCSVCNEILKQQEVIPALGHDFKDGICTRCGAEISGKWLKSGAKWWYQYEDGSYPAGRLCKIGNTWYGFDTSGWMQTGWGIYNNTWYYFSASGAMQTGWLNLGNTWYYLRGDGSMATGWLNLGNTWYYLRGDGSMATGWLNLGNTWYYLRGDGSMATGWLNLGNTWYYLREDGSMATGWLNRENTWYYLRGDGSMATGWLKLENTWYYLRGDGSMASNTWIGNSYVDGSGAWTNSR